ncbi:MAG: hypothetical protein ACM3O3_12825 [Syntrophothermus sp.]
MKVKVYNRNKFDIGVRLINPVREQNIKGNSFSIMEEDDIYYLDTICALFRRGMLSIDNEEINQNLGYTTVNEGIKTEDEIQTILKLNFNKMKIELEKITEPHVIDLVYQVCLKNGNELSGQKLKYLNKFCNKEIDIEEIED